MNSVGVLSAGGLGPGRGALDHRPAGPTSTSPASTSPGSAPGSSSRRTAATRTTEILGTVYAAHTPGKQLRICARASCSRRCTTGWSPRAATAARGRRAGRAPTGSPAAGSRARGRADLGPRAVVRAVGGRAPRRPRGRRADGHVVHGEVRGARAPTPARCSTGSAPARSTPTTAVITYTQWLDDDGRIEADLTVTRLAPDDFLVVASDTAHGHALGLLARRRSATPTVTVDDVTTDFAQLNRAGPARRATPARGAAPTPTVDRGVPVPRRPDGSSWPGSTCSRIRITYLGELGYELYVPADRAVEVWDAVLAAGAAHGIRPVGLQGAVEPADGEGLPRLRPRHRQHRLRARRSGLGFAVALDKPGGFTGREATLARQGARHAAPPRLVQVLLERPRAAAVPRRAGAARRRGRRLRAGGVVRLDPRRRRRAGLRRRRRAGHARSGSPTGSWEVDVAGTRHAARVSLRPMYDPTSARVTG